MVALTPAPASLPDDILSPDSLAAELMDRATITKLLHTALTTLAEIAATSKDPAERRRAATTLLRALTARRPAPRQASKPPRPSPRQCPHPRKLPQRQPLPPPHARPPLRRLPPTPHATPPASGSSRPRPLPRRAQPRPARCERAARTTRSHLRNFPLKSAQCARTPRQRTGGFPVRTPKRAPRVVLTHAACMVQCKSAGARQCAGTRDRKVHHKEFEHGSDTQAHDQRHQDPRV